MIFHKILVHLSVIHTAMKGLIGKCFLKDCAACVILVFQNSENTGLAPALSARGGNLLRIQLPCDMSHAFPRKEISKNALYNNGFIGVNFKLLTIPSVSIRRLIKLVCSALKPLFHRPFFVAGNRHRLILGNAAQNGKHQFAFHRSSIYVFFLKIDRNIYFKQFSHHLKAVGRIPGESAYRLGDDIVDSPRFAIGKQPHKLGAFFLFRAAYSLVIV